jgi:PKD repeat protein
MYNIRINSYGEVFRGKRTLGATPTRNRQLKNFQAMKRSSCLLLAAGTLVLSCHLDEIAPADSCATASFAVVNNGCEAPCVVGFTNSSTNAINPRWDFGDGTISMDGNPQHTYAVGGDYTVTLTVDCPSGGSDHYSQVLSIRPVTFEKAYDHHYDDRAYALLVVPGGGYFIGGETAPDNANTDVLLIKTDARGDTVFGYPATIGGSGSEGCFSMQRAELGVLGLGLSMAGYTNSAIYTGANATQGFLIGEYGFDTYGDPLETYFFSIDTTLDGGFVMAGSRDETIGGGDQNINMYIVKTDKYGSVLFARSIDATLTDLVSCIHATGDGGYIVLASIIENNHFHTYLTKLDASGNVLPGFPVKYGSNNDVLGTDLAVSGDDGYVIVGWTSSGNGRDPFVMKTTIGGAIVFNKTFAQPGPEDRALAVAETADGDYIVTGSGTDLDPANRQIFLLKLDASGGIYAGFPKFFGGAGLDTGNDVKQTADGGFIVAGTIEVAGGGTDAYLIKTDKNGNVLR